MCGLIAMIVPQGNGFTRHELNVMVGSLFINGFRGRDSTGLIAINKDLAAGYFKTVGDVFDLVHAKGWTEQDHEILMTGKTIIGHGRAATRGTVNVDNAHPFYVKNKESGGLYLVHNGTLSTAQRLPGFKEADVDSRWMAEKIAELGPEEALSVIDGPIATMWWNDKLHKMFVYRNYERPLSFVQAADGVVHINSEAAALMWLKHKYTLGYTLPDIHEFRTNFLYEIDVEAPKTPVIKEIKKKPIVHIVSEHHHRTRTWDHKTHQWADDYDVQEARQRNMYRNRGYGTMYDDDDCGLADDCAMFEDASPSMVEQFEKDIDGLHGGLVKKVVFINGNKITTMEDGTVFQETRGAYLPDMTMMQRGHNASIVQLHYSVKRGGSRMQQFNKGEMKKMLRKLKAQEDKEFKENIPDIPNAGIPPVVALPVPLPSTPPKQAAAGGGWCVPGINPEVGKTIWFRTNSASGAQVNHKALCDDWQAQFLKVYWNSRDGIFWPGQEIMVEGHTYKPIGEKSCDVEGFILSTNASPAIDTSFTTSKFGVEEAKKMMNFVGIISTIRIIKEDEHEDCGGIVRITMNNIRSTMVLSDKEISQINESYKLSFDEVKEAMVLKQMPALLQKLPKRIVTYPANEE